MSHPTQNRRHFLQTSALAGSALTMGVSPSNSFASNNEQALHVSTNQYSWHVFYGRDQKNFAEMLDQGLTEVKQSGLDGFEPSANSPEEIKAMAANLKSHSLEMRSIYVNSSLHEKSEAETSISKIIAIAKEAKQGGAQIIVTNPNPINWGENQHKNDEQLKTQAEALNRLGKQLSEMDLTLAYHNHDKELMMGAREFHHCMVGTDPNYVTLCLDSHWIYRGCGNSSVALFDIIKLYRDRITELHLRQSINGVWAETFAEGDINYPALAAYLKKIKCTPHIVLEQAVEKGTPHTLNALKAHEVSAHYVRKIF